MDAQPLVLSLQCLTWHPWPCSAHGSWSIWYPGTAAHGAALCSWWASWCCDGAVSHGWGLAGLSTCSPMSCVWSWGLAQVTAGDCSGCWGGVAFLTPVLLQAVTPDSENSVLGRDRNNQGVPWLNLDLLQLWKIKKSHEKQSQNPSQCIGQIGFWIFPSISHLVPTLLLILNWTGKLRPQQKVWGVIYLSS